MGKEIVYFAPFAVSVAGGATGTITLKVNRSYTYRIVGMKWSNPGSSRFTIAVDGAADMIDATLDVANATATDVKAIETDLAYLHPFDPLYTEVADQFALSIKNSAVGAQTYVGYIAYTKRTITT